MNDNRKGTRQRVLKTGRIVFNEGRSTIDCTVRNLSVDGARLAVASIVGIPETFELVVGTGKPRASKVIWRTGSELGIAFIDG